MTVRRGWATQGREVRGWEGAGEVGALGEESG